MVIYICDIETTGLSGAPTDKVVEIGIAAVDILENKVWREYESIVRQELTPEDKQAWIFTHIGATLTPEAVEDGGKSVGQVRQDLQRYAPGVFTSYNVSFDFDKFLMNYPWYFRPKLAPCLMEEASVFLKPGGGWVTAQQAYEELCPDNPAELPEALERHRALDDAVMEGYILLGLIKARPREIWRYDVGRAIFEEGHP